jgi:16S rRNA processing protein RimM
MSDTKGEAGPFPRELIRIGYVLGAHGVRGAIRIKLDNPASTALCSARRLLISQNHQVTEYNLISSRAAGRGTFKVHVHGVSTAQEAAALRGAIVLVRTDQLPAKGAREFYYFETIGCHVVTTSGVNVGQVEDIFSTAASDILVVRDCSTEHLVPVVEPIVREVDVLRRRIVIEAVPGLLD